MQQSLYGRSGPERLSEDTDLRPISPYGMGKKMMEAGVTYMIDRHGLNGTILRPANPIGLWQSNKLQGVVGALMRAAMSETPFTLIGNGSTIRDYFDVRDLVAAIEAVVLASPVSFGQVYNVGSGRGHSVLEVIALVEKITGKKLSIISKEARSVDVDHVRLDASKLADDCGWRPRFRLEQSISEIWEQTQEANGC